MKPVGKFLLLGSLLALTIPDLASAQSGADCREVIAKVRHVITETPEHTLTIVEDSLVAHPACVCEIVTTAIETSRADAAMVQKIVYVAVKTLQPAAPIIAECAVAAAPDYADSVRLAFAEAFEDQRPRKGSKKKPVAVAANQAPRQPQQSHSDSQQEPTYAPVYDDSGKMVVANGSGKHVVEAEPVLAYEEGPSARGADTFFGGHPIDLSGIYLIPPVASAPPFEPEEEEKIIVRFPPRRSPQRPPVKPPSMSPTGP